MRVHVCVSVCVTRCFCLRNPSLRTEGSRCVSSLPVYSVSKRITYTGDSPTAFLSQQSRATFRPNYYDGFSQISKAVI